MLKRLSPNEYQEFVYFLSRYYPVTMHYTNAIILHGINEKYTSTYVLKVKGEFVVGVTVIGEYAYVYAMHEQYTAMIVEHLKAFNITSLQGPINILTPIHASIESKRLWTTQIMTMKQLNNSVSKSLYQIKKASKYQLKQVNAMVNRIFNLEHKIDIESQWLQMENGHFIQYVVTENNRILGCGSWVNTHPIYGNIVGLCVDEAHRGKGIATQLTTHICKDIQERFKVPYLRYDDPVAQRVYLKLGFKNHDLYGILYL